MAFDAPSDNIKDENMGQERIFAICLIIFGIAAVIVGAWIYFLNDENRRQWEKLPRNVILGSIFAAFDLFWCVPHAKPLLPESLQGYIFPAALVCFFLAYFFLDHLFARAVGGFLILLTYHFLQESFAHHTPALPVFSLFCYVMGVVGIFICGKPYLPRDWIRAFPKEIGYRTAAAIYAASFGALSIVLGVVHWSR